jgi:multidrug resistance efflux pump
MSKVYRSASTIVAAIIGITGALLVLYAWRLPPFTSTVQTTDNAYVRGQVTIISPQLAGYVEQVLVQDFQHVTAGQELVIIDDRIYEQRLEQAKATLATQEAALANSEQKQRSAEANITSSQAKVESAQAAVTQAEASWNRIAPLLVRGVVTQSQADQARATLDQATAALHQAQAALEVSRQDLASTLVNRQSLEAAVQGAQAAVRLAEIDMQNTKIVAPEDGQLGEVGARVGQYVSAGTQLTTIVPQRIWVIANFKETQIPGMKAGQPVTFTVDALEHAQLTGHIERFSPAAGSEFSVIRTDNATGNFTKVAQRIPVRISIDPGQPLAERLAPGMSVVASVDTSAPASDVHSTGATAQAPDTKRTKKAD